jgi:hypothetical protein
MDIQKMRQQAQVLRNKRLARKIKNKLIIKNGIVRIEKDNQPVQIKNNPLDKSEIRRKAAERTLKQRRQMRQQERAAGCSGCRRKIGS